LYSFNPTNGDGSGEKSSLILSGNTLYGTTQSGGSSGNGTVFAVHTDGTGFTNLHTFSALVRMTTSPFLYTNGDGALPQGSLVLSGNKLYGTTFQGGNSLDNSSTAGGTVFALNTDGTSFANLHNFGTSTGNSPHAGLVLSGSTLYGTASAGGSLASQKSGTLFAINPDGTSFATLHTFTPSRPMMRPDSAMRRSVKISRSPKCTVRSSSSMTGCEGLIFSSECVTTGSCIIDYLTKVQPGTVDLKGKCGHAGFREPDRIIWPA
jgi:uncharacterized repeat protein (TIGR03803 family)